MSKSSPLLETVIGETAQERVAVVRAAAIAVKVGGKTALKGSAGTTVKAMANSCGKTVGKSVVKSGGRLAGRIAPALSVVEFGIDQVQTARARARGEITQSQYEVRTAGNVGSAAGGLGGSWGGAAIGTAICPGLGTIVGALIGGLFGSSVGRATGETLLE
jgi:hypothetical protein